jgi:hypothetical protein
MINENNKQTKDSYHEIGEIITYGHAPTNRTLKKSPAFEAANGIECSSMVPAESTAALDLNQSFFSSDRRRALPQRIKKSVV